MKFSGWRPLVPCWKHLGGKQALSVARWAQKDQAMDLASLNRFQFVYDDPVVRRELELRPLCHDSAFDVALHSRMQWLAFASAALILGGLARSAVESACRQ